MLKKVKFIYNPSSGENSVTEYLDEIIALYQERGFSIVPYRLSFSGDPMDIISDLDASYDHLLIAGGDGTVNFVVNLLKKNGVDIPVGVIPAGTANDFAALLGLTSGNILKSCRMLLDGRVSNIDLGVVNGEYFVNVFSCGLFTDISQKTPTIIKNTFGRIAYYINGLTELPRFHRMNLKLESDGGNFEGSCLILLVFNGRTAGRLKLAYLSEVDDGFLDVLVFKGDNPQETLQTIFHYLSLQGKHKSYPPGVVHLRCSHLTATSDRTETTDIDGQPGPAFPLEIKCEKGGLRVLHAPDMPL